MDFLFPRLYAIIDPAQTGDASPVSIAEILLLSGVRLIQYRDKRATSRELFSVASQLAPLVHEAKGIFIVNDRADISRAVGADGVHVGQEDLPVELARRVVGGTAWVGCSTHTMEQVAEAEKTTANYVAFGPIFPTQSKENPDPAVGLDALRQARLATRKPLVAIGGIKAGNARAVIEAGADSLAVIGDLLCAKNLDARAREFLREIEPS